MVVVNYYHDFETLPNTGGYLNIDIAQKVYAKLD